MTAALTDAGPPRLRRIHDVAAEVGLTTRTIRYYEALGLIAPAARSGGDYRLFAPADVARLRAIKALRDDAGFSLAEIGQLLADDEATARGRAAYHATMDPLARRAIAVAGLDRVERQIGLLRAKIERLAAMVGEAEARRARLVEAVSMIDESVKDPAR